MRAPRSEIISHRSDAEEINFISKEGAVRVPEDEHI